MEEFWKSLSPSHSKRGFQAVIVRIKSTGLIVRRSFCLVSPQGPEAGMVISPLMTLRGRSVTVPWQSMQPMVTAARTSP